MGNNQLFKLIGKKKPHARKVWTQILADHSRARRVRAPFARSPARRGEQARACVLPSSSHPHLQEHGEHPTI
jgi:hypothetical protein